MRKMTRISRSTAGSSDPRNLFLDHPLICLLVLLGIIALVIAWPARSAPNVKGLSFYPVDPCRALDVPVFAGSPQPLTFGGTLCGVPSSARAVTMNVTIAAPTADGDLTLETFPLLSFLAGETVSNGALTRPSMTAVLSAGQAQLQIDVTGYFQ